MLIAALFLAFCWLQGAAAAWADDEGGSGAVVNCYDPERGIVQSKFRHECTGRVLSDDEADSVRTQRKAERLERFRNQRPEAPEPRSRSGSGFYVSGAGHVLTAWHVVENCREIMLGRAGENHERAEVVARSHEADLALLMASRKSAVVIPVSETTETFVAGDVTALGYPNLGRTAIRPIETEGRILGRQEMERGRPPMLVLQATVHPGNSGGPVFNTNGRLVGVVVGMVNSSAVFEQARMVIRDVAFAEDIGPVLRLLRSAGLEPPRNARPAQAPEKAVVQVNCRTMR